MLMWMLICSLILRYVNISVMQAEVSEQQSGRRHARQQATLLHTHSEIVRLANERRDHIPPLTSALITFPFDILVEGCVLTSRMI